MKRHKHARQPVLNHNIPTQGTEAFTHGNFVLHTTKGWRKIRANVPATPWWLR